MLGTSGPSGSDPSQGAGNTLGTDRHHKAAYRVGLIYIVAYALPRADDNEFLEPFLYTMLDILICAFLESAPFFLPIDAIY